VSDQYRKAKFISGVEAMRMIKKEQIDLRDQSVQNQKEFIHQLFGLVA
jgi:transposase, IS6 family